MATHSILLLRYIVDRLQELGSDTAPTLSRYGLDMEKIAPDSRIDCALELRIFCSLSELSNDPTVGLNLGARLGLSGYGAFSLMLMTCATSWEAMLTSRRYQALTYLFSNLELTLGQSSSELAFKPAQMPDWPGRLRIDMEMAGCLKLQQDLSQAGGTDLLLEQVSLPYPRPPEYKTYEAFFGCPVSFGDSHARMRISNRSLQQPLAGADRMANAMYRQECDRLLDVALRESSSDLAEQVRQHLMLFQGGYPDAPSIAAVFGMSERSLRTRLSSQQTSYRQLLDEVRHTRACQLLEQTRDAIESIALQLGYAETASFIHAFKRWAGCTPARYRRTTDKPASTSNV